MSHRIKVVLWKWGLVVYVAAVLTSLVLQHVVLAK